MQGVVQINICNVLRMLARYDKSQVLGLCCCYCYYIISTIIFVVFAPLPELCKTI